MITMSDSTERMETIFRIVFDQPDLRVSDDLVATEMPGCDHLLLMGLMFSLEAEFDVTFDDDEISALRDVGQLRRAIEAKLSA
jgi:acyl carrier protein